MLINALVDCEPEHAKVLKNLPVNMASVRDDCNLKLLQIVGEYFIYLAMTENEVA